MEISRRYIIHDPHAARRRAAEDRAAVEAFEATELETTLERLSEDEMSTTPEVKVIRSPGMTMTYDHAKGIWRSVHTPRRHSARPGHADHENTAAIEPRRKEMATTTTDTPTGIVPSEIIGALGLAPDASAQDVVRRISNIEGAPRDSLTQDEIGAIAKMRTALGLAANATTADVIAKLRTKLAFFAASGGTPVLVLASRHHGAGERVDHAIATSVLTALGLAADATPSDVIAKVTELDAAKKQATTSANNEAHALDSLRNLLGLDASATDDDIVVALREFLQTPAIIDQAILTRRLGPTLRGWAEGFAAKQGVAALRKFVAASGPYDVRADQIVADLARERVRWSRGRLDFHAAMNEVAHEHPDLVMTHQRDMQRRTRTNGSD